MHEEEDCRRCVLGGGEIVESRGDAIHRVSIGTSRSNDFGDSNSNLHRHERSGGNDADRSGG